MGEIISIVYTPKDSERSQTHFTRLPLSEASLITGQGIEGDSKGGSEHRQLNIMAAETLDKLQNEGFKTNPGEMGEQIVIRGLPLDTMEAGTRIQFGDSAVVELLKLRSGCPRFEKIQDCSIEQVKGRLGMMASVIHDGQIRVGDEVNIVKQETV